MARGLDIYNLLSQPDAYRDEGWERAFFEAFVETPLKITQEQPQAGPDGWPYLLVSTERDASEPAAKVLQWLSDKGIGMALNTHKTVPDYIFTYGMIWNYRERGQFLTPATQVETGPVVFEQGTQVMAGAPTKDYLPDYVRQVLKQFFVQQNIKQPKILVVSKDKKHFDLCFSLESMGSPPETEHPGIAEAIAWFLPIHYSVLLSTEQGLPTFVEL